MCDVKKIEITAYDYPLDEERIAKFPLAQRDTSKLLVLKNKKIETHVFHEIGTLLPSNSLLVCNETKVIQARLQFRKNETSALIELFCLEPFETDYQIVFGQGSPVVWKCLVGNSKKWKEGVLLLQIPLADQIVELKAERLEKKETHSLIRFSWNPAKISFAALLEVAGKTPLPPYLHRESEQEDKERYQTVFARFDGSVAAPTASLHLTETLMCALQQQGHRFAFLTLHVGAGTFKPVASQTIGDHEMHSETIIVSKQSIANLIETIGNPIIAIGTTSFRTLESLYWFGVMLGNEKNFSKPFHLDQWYPYQQQVSEISTEQALQNIVTYLEQTQQTKFVASTALMIVPGYRFKVATGIVTNFHQPKSTLLLLVSALIGEQWKKVYDYALKNNFRFLSYGDSCLFIP
ncbi:MAG: S-adenosylmethionine:tRNA ribosyltransferase-isomerase [Lentimicrobiaceae bacterium]|jgi:S-adenosylmethionine:tRNA ribosyltransferase-isomerase|nr:S-adenosylmethionine:tRNA ribosyltransferase-isomerase [Lentimicrobiaceae bacterium]